MKVILDELYLDEFFQHGGVIVIKDKKIDSYEEWSNQNHDFSEMIDAYIGDSHFDYDELNDWFSYKKPEPKVKIDDKDPYRMKNVNFSLIGTDDKRWEEYKRQREEIGFDDSELWNLDVTIAKFILPRLRRYAKIKCGYPARLKNEEWDHMVDKMVEAFEIYLGNTDLMSSEDTIRKFCRKGIIEMDEEEAVRKHEAYEEGMEYFSEWWTWLGD